MHSELVPGTTSVNFAGSPHAIRNRRPAPFHSAGDAVSRLRWWLLGAGPDMGRMDAGIDGILTGMTDLGGYATYLADSSVHASTVPTVTRLYYAAFDRNPDTDGLLHWTRARQGGTSLDSIARYFSSSTEFKSKYGSLTTQSSLFGGSVVERI